MPSDDEQHLLDTCLGPLMMRLDRTRAGYRYYQESGKTFRGALVLFNTNKDLVLFMLATCWMLPGDLNEQATRIINHIDIWASLWEHHRDLQQPGLDDAFAFPNDHRFPADAEATLKDYYKKLRGPG